MNTIVIPFKHLTSKNAKLVVWQGRPRLSKAYKEGKEAIYRIARAQVDEPFPAEERVTVYIYFYMPDKHRRDILNYTQQLCDGLEGAAYDNDYQIDEVGVYRMPIDRENPRVEVTVHGSA